MTSLCILSDLVAAFTNVLSFIFHMLSTKSRVWSMHLVFSFFVLKLSVCLYVWVGVCVREWGPCLCICCIFIHLNLFIHLIALWMTMKFIFSSSSSSSSFKALLLHLVGNRLRLRLGRCCRRCYRWRFTFPFSISLYPIMHVSLKFMQDVCLFAMFIYLFILYILIFFIMLNKRCRVWFSCRCSSILLFILRFWQCKRKFFSELLSHPLSNLISKISEVESNLL